MFYCPQCQEHHEANETCYGGVKTLPPSPPPQSPPPQSLPPSTEQIVRRDGYEFCQMHQQEYRQYCCGCALNLPSQKPNTQTANTQTADTQTADTQTTDTQPTNRPISTEVFKVIQENGKYIMILMGFDVVRGTGDTPDQAEFDFFIQLGDWLDDEDNQDRFLEWFEQNMARLESLCPPDQEKKEDDPARPSSASPSSATTHTGEKADRNPSDRNPSGKRFRPNRHRQRFHPRNNSNGKALLAKRP